MTTLTVLGGGQLGRMLALAAIPLGVDVRTLDPSADATAAAASTLTVGALDDLVALRIAASDADVVTFEWEGVPVAGVRTLERHGFTVRPATGALEVAQDRISEKTVFAALGIPVPSYASVANHAELVEAVEIVGIPAVLKTCRGGYDGKGQVTIAAPTDVETAWSQLGPAGALVLEARIPFDRELSLLAVRAVNGDRHFWPLVENEHRDGILRSSRAPAERVTPPMQATAERYARALLDHFDYVGVLAIELFQVGDDLLANEMAPRVHNSGHWTIEGSATSQFENHVRAVLGWPLGPITMAGPSAMMNCIGSLPDPAAIIGLPGVHFHRYGKALRPGRKVGHITVTATDPAELDTRVAALRELLPADVG